MSPLLRTPLYLAHREAGARVVEFAGWEMPLQYSGILAEHQAVRTAAGLFDVSHMGRIALSGPDAGVILGHLITSDIAGLPAGRARYGLLCNESGGILDDVVTLRLALDEYLVVCNAASWDRVLAWMGEKAQGRAVEVVPRRDETVMLALQGPGAARLLSSLCGEGVAALKRFGVAELQVRGAHLIVSRTGYTGEDGFEIITETSAAVGLWYTLLEDALPCGLGARDTLRLEAGLLLYGQDMGTATTPLEAGLERFVALEKEFIGAEALREQARRGLQRRLAGLVVEGRQVPRHGYPVFLGERLGGSVTSGGFSPALQGGIGLAYLPPEVTPGTEVWVDIRGRKTRGKVLTLPFYRGRGSYGPGNAEIHTRA
ncbi:MAG: glycine cleavage system aminomethyltransferase GcvT [Chloroflexi bacterium]|nr:glycine cleavage system aminomethyltransferase GcvT [Chloroflexota bacterium]